MLKTASFEYYMRDEKGWDVKVCQKPICGVYGFGPKQLQRNKITSDEEESKFVWDKCGKHTEHLQRLMMLIQEHIRSFPARNSHYSHSDNSGRVYLSPDLSIAQLYRDFLGSRNCEENHERIISYQQ